MVRIKREKKVKEMAPSELAAAPDSVVIAWNFVRIRERLGLTQEQAAEQGDVTASYVGKVETAAVSFGTRAQQKWARIFGVGRPEFLKRPEGGLEVSGYVTDRGSVEPVPPGTESERVAPPPGYTEDRARKEGVSCLKVATDALHPHLRRDTYLYIATVPLAALKDDNFVLYAPEDEQPSIKEVEWLCPQKLLFKGLGRGGSVGRKASRIPFVQKVIFIGM
jgi:transcriptional regulator with XRE-family HTH domain